MSSRLFVVVLLTTMSLGCGDGGIPRFDLRGEALCDGKPIPSGKITFQPDRTRGNVGPSATALIVQGKYETQPGKGVTAGPQDVLVYAYDGSPPSETRPFGKPLAEPFSTSIEVSDESTEHDFEIPKE